MNNNMWILIILLPLIAWRLHSRMRKLIGVQQVHETRLWVTVILFALIFVLMFSLFLHQASALVGLVSGALLGLMVALLALRLTEFNHSGTDLTYKPNAIIGIAVMSLIIGRLAYRFIQVANAGADPSKMDANTINSPFTLLLGGLVFIYYSIYALGVLRRHQIHKAGMNSN